MSKHLIPATLIALLLLATSASDAAAQQKWEFTPTVGYQFWGKLGTAMGDVGIDAAADFGFIVDLRLQEQIQLEFSYNNQRTELNLDDVDSDIPPDQPLNVDIRYFQGGVLWHVDDEFFRPFATVTAGVTWWDPTEGDRSGATAFSVVMGLGLKYFFNYNIGVRGQFRLASTFLTQEGELFCSTTQGCVTGITSGTIIQGDLSLGLIIAF